MDEVIEQAKKVKQELNSLPITKEFLQLKELYENDEELKRMRKDIAYLSSQGKKEEADNLRNIYNSHPLVNNYLLAKEEMKSLLMAIQNILE